MKGDGRFPFGLLPFEDFRANAGRCFALGGGGGGGEIWKTFIHMIIGRIMKPRRKLVNLASGIAISR